MDRNNFIILILCSVLLLAWNPIIVPMLPKGWQPIPAPKEKVDPESQPLDSSEGQTNEKSTDTLASTEEVTTELAEGEEEIIEKIKKKLPERKVIRIPEKEIKIETEKLIVIFSNKGGIIKSLAMKDFHPEVDSKEPLLVIKEDSFESMEKASTMESQLEDKDGKQTLTFTSNDVSKSYTFDDSHFFTYTYEDKTGKNKQALNLKPLELSSVGLLGGRMHGAFYSFKGGEDNSDVYNDQHLEDTPIQKSFAPGTLDYAGFRNKYFTCMVEPVGEPRSQSILFNKLKAKTSQLTLSVNDQSKNQFKIYAGPVNKEYLLNANPEKYSPLFDFYGVDIVIHLLLKLLDIYNKIPGINMGFAIILLTLTVRLALFPLNLKAQSSMFMMSKLSPDVKKLQEKFKNDRQQLGIEQMKLFRENGVNPLAGCLPMLIQMPVLFSLFTAIGDGFILRHEPFMFWIKDVSMPDSFSVVNLQIPLLDSFVGNHDGTTNINLLVLFYVITMFIQQSMMPKSTDPQQQQMQKTMKFMMLAFAVLLYNYSSGLMIYFVGSNILSMFESWFIKKKVLPKMEERRGKKKSKRPNLTDRPHVA